MFNNKEYVQKLNQLFEENKIEDFFILADKLKSLFFGEILSFTSKNEEVHISANDLFFIPELQSGAVRLLLTKEEYKKDFILNIKYGTNVKHILFDLFDREYREMTHLEDEYEIKSNEVKEVKYNNFIDKLLILKENGVDLNMLNSKKERFFVNSMQSISTNGMEYIDEFIVNKIPDFFNKLKELDIEITEDEFNLFLSKQNLLYTDEVLPGIKKFCEMFPEYKIHPRTLLKCFYIENIYGEYSTYDSFCTIEHMNKSDLTIESYDIQENSTLLKYFTERDNINYNHSPFNKIDFLKNTLFQETANILIENGARIKENLSNYSKVVEVEYLDFMEREKEIISKNLTAEEKISIKKRI